MDEEKLNNDLKNRINEVFDNYDDTGADEGWLLLREKFPPKEKDRGLSWLWYAAAAVFLICLSIWFIPKNNSAPQYAVQNRKQSDNPAKKSVEQAVVDAAKIQPDQLAQSDTVTKSDTVINKQKKARVHISNALYAAMIKSAAHKEDVVNNKAIPQDTDATHKATAGNNIANVPNKSVVAPDSKLPDTTLKTNTQYAQTPPPPVKQPAKDNDINNLFNSKTIAGANGKKQTLKESKKIILGIYAATYFNYAKGSDNQINVGAGFTADIPLTEHLKLSTGLFLSQNSLNYNNTAIPNPVQTEPVFSTLAASASFAAGTPILSGSSTLTTTGGPATGIKDYNASLVGLDIPVNLKYLFNPQKSDLYIAAGVSSGTFVNENYKATYTYSQIVRENTTHNSFSGFDLAKTLNFSFGMGYPVSNSNRLIIEPFLKYPLNGLGAEQIKFGSGGINLKLNFSSGKK